MMQQDQTWRGAAIPILWGNARAPGGWAQEVSGAVAWVDFLSSPRVIALRRQMLARDIADFERRYPHNTVEAQRARRARSLDVELDRMERAEAARDRSRALGAVLAWLQGASALNAWRQRRYAARRAGRRAIIDHWLARRPL